MATLRSRIEIEATELTLTTDPDGFRIDAREEDIRVSIRMTKVIAGVMHVKLGKLLGVPDAIDSLNAELNSSTAKVSLLRGDAADRSTEIRLLQGDTKRLRGTLDNMREELTSSRIEHTKTESHRDELLAANGRFLAELAKWNNENADLRVGLTRRDDDIRQLERRLESSEGSSSFAELHTKYLALEKSATAREDELLGTIKGLRLQLSEGGGDAKIQFIQCEAGHGRLVASGWMLTLCPQCEINRLNVLVAERVQNIKRLNALLAERPDREKIKGLEEQVKELKAEVRGTSDCNANQYKLLTKRDREIAVLKEQAKEYASGLVVQELREKVKDQQDLSRSLASQTVDQNKEIACRNRMIGTLEAEVTGLKTQLAQRDEDVIDVQGKFVRSEQDRIRQSKASRHVASELRAKIIERVQRIRRYVDPKDMPYGKMIFGEAGEILRALDVVVEDAPEDVCQDCLNCVEFKTRCAMGSHAVPCSQLKTKPPEPVPTAHAEPELFDPNYTRDVRGPSHCCPVCGDKTLAVPCCSRPTCVGAHIRAFRMSR